MSNDGRQTNRQIGNVHFFLQALALASAVFASCANADDWTGRVVGVTDGDTIEVMRDGKAVRVRLWGIDCPESSQAFGSRAKQFTSEAVFGKDVRVAVRDTDRYGRTVGEVFTADGKRLNDALVTAGLAWWYAEYAPQDVTLQRRQLNAMERKAGLWSEPNPTPPWDFRRGGSAVSRAADQPTPATVKATAAESSVTGEVYVTRSGTKYHRDGCRYLASGKIPMTLEQAAAGGYTPCSVCNPPSVESAAVQNEPQHSPAARAPPTLAPSSTLRAVQPRQAPARPVPTYTAPAPQPPQGDPTVYVTRTGDKYHNAGCQYVRQSGSPMSLSAAKASGYTACSRCGPPR